MSSEKLFDTIKDGAWHNLKDLSREIGVQIDRLATYARSLSKQGIVKYEEDGQRIRIEPEWKILLPSEIEPIRESSK